jgi:hypothetical protein
MLWAYDFQSGDLYYNIIHDKNGYSAEVISNDSYKSLQSVTIPNSIPYRRGVLPVTSIEKNAFTGCKSLTAISIPSSITRIGQGFMRRIMQSSGAFAGTGIYNDSSNWKNGALCIDSCLIDVSEYVPNTYKISNDVRLIADFAFQDCSSLKSLTIPNSVTSIGTGAFLGCSLTSITIPNSVTYIGQSAFSYCESLKSITIPNSVTEIKHYTFNGCYSLSSITIPNSVTRIEEGAFSYCESLKSITIPNSVTSIGKETFNGCSALTSITIPNSVKSIGDKAFKGCSALTSITISNSVTEINGSEFFGCKSLKTIIFEGTVEQWKAIYKEKKWNANIPATHVQCTDGEVELEVINE